VSSGALFSLRNLLQKRYFSHYGGPQTMLYQTLVASVMLCAFITVPPSALSQSHLSLILLAGIIFTALPHALFASSLRHLSATTAGLISCLQPLYATFLAFMLLAEKPSIVTFIGGLLVVSTAFYETWSVTRNKA
jgi:drug/metabolite transporter (DMT)-like permease